MLFTADGLLNSNKNEPAITTVEESVQSVLAIMLKNDYSQMPVVADRQGKYVLGIITLDSILEAVYRLKFSLDKLIVKDAYNKKIKTWKPDDDVFDLLDSLKDNRAVLITDNEGCLLSIVTTYDTTEYLRQQAEDMMLIEDIERSLKEHIKALYTEDSSLNEAISQVEQSKMARAGEFKKALQHYMKLTGLGQAINAQAAEEASSMIRGSSVNFSLDTCTFNDLIQLLLKRWDQASNMLGGDKSAIHRNLEAMRDIRNALAHFRDITPEQQEHLRSFQEWLMRHEPAQPEPAIQTQMIQAVQIKLGAGESKYSLLAQFLKNQPPNDTLVRLSMDQIEEIIQDKLPPSARQHKSWWANDSVSHVQSRLWLAAGWKVARMNFVEQTVTFIRENQ